jgi:hypothetical protein
LEPVAGRQPLNFLHKWTLNISSLLNTRFCHCQMPHLPSVRAYARPTCL